MTDGLADRSSQGVLNQYPPRTKAKDATHRCPVCRRSYYPRHTWKLEGQTGVMRVRVDDQVCVKGTDEWVMAYWHHPDAEPGVGATELEAPQ